MRAAILAPVLALLAAACAAPPASTSTPPSTAAPTSGAATPAAFLAMQLTDVRTGERFTLGGSSGKVVIVEGMAVW
jgi:uncharacterized lipoprotein YajG